MAFLDLYRWMLAARCTDVVEEELVARGEAFFQVSGVGHESSAVLQRHLTPDDWLHCHYRDKALMIARGVRPRDFFDSLFCNAVSHSAGRQMSAHLSAPDLHILSIVAPVGNSALQAAGVAAAVKGCPGQPLVVCSLGDGMTQEGEVLEAIAEAVRFELPVLFWVANNGYSISTPTRGKTFFSLPPDGRNAAEFYGVPIVRLDGRDVAACDAPVQQLVARMRADRRPAIVVCDVERVADHTSADDERLYRSEGEIFSAVAEGDPLTRLLEHLVAREGAGRDVMDELAHAVMADVRAAAAEAAAVADPQPCFDAKREVPIELCSASNAYGGDPSAEPRLTMLEAFRETLRHWLASDDRVSLYGQDIEDPKGDVFRLTAGLTAPFTGRVRNAPLSESTIVGTAIGRALAGERPVAFVQFADFLPLAFNQIATELATMHWRTRGGWQCPVVVMSPCGGYRPGLGPFHAQTFESVIAHMPGLDVAMPSTAADAAGVLNAAFRSGRPTVVLYPKSLLNDRRRTTSSGDVARQLAPIGLARRLRDGGRDLTIVTWGSTVELCERAADALAEAGASVELIDLRWLSPWDEAAVVESAARTGRLLVVHEDSQSCGFGAEVVATVSERLRDRALRTRRVTRGDTYVPCNFPNQLTVLPSFRSVMTAAAEMLDYELTWEAAAPTSPAPSGAGNGTFAVQAVGSSPSDESVVVAELRVAAGSPVAAGDVLACLDCNKATFDLEAPVGGVVRRVHAAVGQTLPVGAVMFDLETAASEGRKRQVVREETGVPKLVRRDAAAAGRNATAWPHEATAGAEARVRDVGVSHAYVAEGTGALTNAELEGRFPAHGDDAIFTRTGIRSRRRIGAGQSALTLGVEAARAALVGERLAAADLDTVICATSTPPAVCPSLACRIIAALSDGSTPALELPAYDIFAACTGYLYALGQAYDFLQTRPSGRVLVLTVEAMSTVVDPDDFDTAILFGDAATATVVYGESHLAAHGNPADPARWSGPRMLLRRPVLSARGDDADALCVPSHGSGACVSMNGKKVFTEAVRAMQKMLVRACAEAGVASPEALDLIVPHQANGRIIDAVRQRVGPKANVADRIVERGNTSSCSIPLVLADVMREPTPLRRIGLCAFGGGFTYGAAILEAIERTPHV